MCECASRGVTRNAHSPTPNSQSPNQHPRGAQGVTNLTPQHICPGRMGSRGGWAQRGTRLLGPGQGLAAVCYGACGAPVISCGKDGCAWASF